MPVRLADPSSGRQYTYQIALNGSRLGFYEPFRHAINSVAGYDKNQTKVWSSIAAGASSGVVGGESRTPQSSEVGRC